MRAHKKDEEYDLEGVDQLTARHSKKNLCGVSHIMDLRITELKLAEDVSGVGC